MRLVLACLFLVSSASAAELTAVDIVQKATESEAKNLAARRQYTFREAAKGQMGKRSMNEVHEIFYIADQEYRKLVEEKGSPLTPDRAAKEQAKFDKEVEKFRREDPEKSRKRLEKERREQQLFRNEVVRAFDFRLVGEEPVSGRPCYRIHAEPRPGYKAKGDASVLSKLRGDIWIDKENFNWTKLDVESIDTITAIGGIVRLAKGTKVFGTRTFVNGEVWFPDQMEIKAKARALLLISALIDLQAQYSAFKKFSVDSKVVFSQE